MSQDTEHLRLTRLEIRNFKRLRAVSFRIKRGLNIVTSGGKNRQGKTSAAQALYQLFHGAGAEPENPIHDETSDEDVRAEVEGWISNGWRVETRRTEKGRYLFVRDPEGRKAGNQGTLSQWVGERAFQLGRFWDLSEEERTEAILALSPDETLLDRLRENAERHAELYEERTPYISDQNRLRKVAQTPPEGERPEPVDTSREMSRLQKLRAVEEKRTSLAQKHNDLRREVKQLAGKGEELKEEIAELEAALARKRERLGEVKGKIEAGKEDMARLRKAHAEAPDPTEEIAEVEGRLNRAAEINEQIEPWREWERTKERYEEAAAKVEELTGLIESVREERKELLATADLPVDGISVDEEGKLLLEGRPLSAASGRQRKLLEIQAAIAENPRLRLVVCDEADGIDTEGRREIAELAEEYNLDVILFQLHADEGSDLEIIDGMGSNVPEEERAGGGADAPESDEEAPEPADPVGDDGEREEEKEAAPDLSPEEFLLGDDEEDVGSLVGDELEEELDLPF